MSSLQKAHVPLFYRIQFYFRQQEWKSNILLKTILFDEIIVMEILLLLPNLKYLASKKHFQLIGNCFGYDSWCKRVEPIALDLLHTSDGGRGFFLFWIICWRQSQLIWFSLFPVPWYSLKRNRLNSSKEKQSKTKNKKKKISISQYQSTILLCTVIVDWITIS